MFLFSFQQRIKTDFTNDTNFFYIYFECLRINSCVPSVASDQRSSASNI